MMHEAMTDEEFLTYIRKQGYTKSVITREIRALIMSSILRVKSGAAPENNISLDKECLNYKNCAGIKPGCDFCRKKVVVRRD